MISTGPSQSNYSATESIHHTDQNLRGPPVNAGPSGPHNHADENNARDDRTANEPANVDHQDDSYPVISLHTRPSSIPQHGREDPSHLFPDIDHQDGHGQDHDTAHRAGKISALHSVCLNLTSYQSISNLYSSPDLIEVVSLKLRDHQQSWTLCGYSSGPSVWP